MYVAGMVLFRVVDGMKRRTDASVPEAQAARNAVNLAVPDSASVLVPEAAPAAS